MIKKITLEKGKDISKEMKHSAILLNGSTDHYVMLSSYLVYFLHHDIYGNKIYLHTNLPHLINERNCTYANSFPSVNNGCVFMHYFSFPYVKPKYEYIPYETVITSVPKQHRK
jgi:hypothetical protein